MSITSTMFATHFGSSISGAVVWWDNTTDADFLSCYVTLNMYANPLIIDTNKKTTPTCAADGTFLVCDTATALSATTAATSTSKTIPTFAFGIVW